VPSGLLGLGNEYYVPLSAIREVHGDKIYLNVGKDRLEELESDTAMAETTDELVGTQGRTLELREEELSARKRSVQSGEVTLTTDVISEQRTMDVPVTREEVTVERKPVDRRPSDRPISESDQTISVPVHEEQVRPEKRTVVYEEVGLEKHAVQETERVSGTVRREEAVVDKDGRVDVDGSTDSNPPSRSA
jgi:uncharacterized protein (TIGR02271 family)